MLVFLVDDQLHMDKFTAAAPNSLGAFYGKHGCRLFTNACRHLVADLQVLLELEAIQF